jgi:quercetin dioxygenase-like cupin family protein
MKELEMSESARHEYLDSHQLSGSAILLDIEDESKEILRTASAAGVKHAAKTLIKDGPLRMVILGFISGASLREHSAGGPVSIQVLSGSAEITAGEVAHAVGAGSTLVLGSDVAHSVTARADAVLLLTIASNGQ